MPLPASSSFMPTRISSHWEWSVVESDVSEISLWPLARSPSTPHETTCSAGRSRTGRYVMPAWQNRQPRAQPRSTSSESRSWTMPM